MCVQAVHAVSLRHPVAGWVWHRGDGCRCEGAPVSWAVHGEVILVAMTIAGTAGEGGASSRDWTRPFSPHSCVGGANLRDLADDSWREDGNWTGQLLLLVLVLFLTVVLVLVLLLESLYCVALTHALLGPAVHVCQ